MPRWDDSWDGEGDALKLLGSLHTCTLSTCDADGQPHACSLLYAHDGFRLYWFSDPASRHSRHIAAAPERRVVMNVAGDHADFTDIHGLQMFGIAKRLINPLKLASAMALLAGRYGFLKQFLAGGPAMLGDAMKKAAIYRFTALEVTYIDNRRGFGAKRTFIPEGEETT